MPEAQDTYARYEGACYRVVGRFVAGLPYETSVFAGLPPFFKNLDGTDKNHEFLSSHLIRDVGLPQILNKKLIYHRWCPGDMMRASGIAPHLR
ncbi:hypothetical protein PHMEG_00030463 [Phytophthora megakarya]|uniref:Uncharacterized protein n=1 Tax=Phytophthora megakarya TaxID=4795 RepID=A0A225V100_9STRA|nr:hypothetical protein PHMEG_00030463 [Phytophthora megakarya]